MRRTKIKETEANSAVLKIIQKYQGLKPTQWVRTGIHALDLIIGGGIPGGKVIEIFGTEAAGKSMLAWIIAKVYQKMGGVVILLDVESSAPEKFMRELGVDTSLVTTPDLNGTIEDIRDQLIQIINELRETGFDGPILVILDSIAQTTSINEFEDFDKQVSKEHSMGARAKAFSEFFRQHGKFLHANNVTMICLNQIREKIGVMFGKNTESPGGKALKFYASVRIELNRGKRITSGERVVGVECHATIQKNKCAPMFRKATLRIEWGKGFDPLGGLEDVLVEAGRITAKKGGGLKVGEKDYEKIDLALTENSNLLDPWEN